MRDRLLTREDVMVKLNCRQRKFYDILKLESFPKPFTIEGLSTHQWSENEIDEWINEQKKNRINKVYKSQKEVFGDKYAS